MIPAQGYAKLLLQSQMCIRDSFMAAFPIITGLLVGVLIGAVTEVYTSGDYRFVKKIAKPVSYTHLDVYKRQASCKS